VGVDRRDRSLIVIVQFNITPKARSATCGRFSRAATPRTTLPLSAVRAVNPLEPVPEKYRSAFATVELTFRASDLDPDAHRCSRRRRGRPRPRRGSTRTAQVRSTIVGPGVTRYPIAVAPSNRSSAAPATPSPRR
jgi:hypothetical protein